MKHTVSYKHYTVQGILAPRTVSYCGNDWICAIFVVVAYLLSFSCLYWPKFRSNLAYLSTQIDRTLRTCRIVASCRTYNEILCWRTIQSRLKPQERSLGKSVYYKPPFRCWINRYACSSQRRRRRSYFCRKLHGLKGKVVAHARMPRAVVICHRHTAGQRVCSCSQCCLACDTHTDSARLVTAGCCVMRGDGSDRQSRGWMPQLHPPAALELLACDDGTAVETPSRSGSSGYSGLQAATVWAHTRTQTLFICQSAI